MKNLNLKEVESLLTDVMESYLERIGENTDKDNNTPFNNEDELMTDFFIYLENTFGDGR